MNGTQSGGIDVWYDPTNTAKGYHFYPYYYQVWAYDANDLLAVKAGSMQYYEPTPYAVWHLDFPIMGTSRETGGVGWDPVTRRIYFAVQSVASGGQGVIHVLEVDEL